MDENTRPYAAAANVIDMIRRYRSRNLPEQLDATDFRTAGVPEGMVPRTAVALRFLRLLEDDNAPTEEWRALCSADEEAYKERLAQIIRNAYADVLRRVNPAVDTQDQIKSAFQPYQPKSQIDRMVVLFLALCREAGIETADAPKRRPALNKASKGRGAGTENGRFRTTDSGSTGKPDDRNSGGGSSGGSGNSGGAHRDLFSTMFGPPPPAEADYAAVHAVVARLPKYGRWTESQRDRWIKALTAVVELATEITEPEEKQRLAGQPAGELEGHPGQTHQPERGSDATAHPVGGETEG